MRHKLNVFIWTLATFLGVIILFVIQMLTDVNKTPVELKFEPIPIYHDCYFTNLPDKFIIEVTQDTLDKYTEEDKALMKIAKAEAGVDGVEGMCMVMAVVYNRVKSSKFPNTVEEVILEHRTLSNGKTIYQFSTVQDGLYQKASINAQCEQALQSVKNGDYDWVDALFFENAESSWQQQTRDYLYTKGHHRFYK